MITTIDLRDAEIAQLTQALQDACDHTEMLVGEVDEATDVAAHLWELFQQANAAKRKEKREAETLRNIAAAAREWLEAKHEWAAVTMGNLESPHAGMRTPRLLDAEMKLRQALAQVTR